MNSDAIILTLPTSMAGSFHSLEIGRPDVFACSDPNVPLGSGGGTCHALVEAWKSSGERNFVGWLEKGRKIVIHAGGQSRRLPAYSAVGKALIPIAIERGSTGQRFDQCLLDLQMESLQVILDAAPVEYRVIVISGDALVRISGSVGKIDEADVACLGFECSPEILSGFGAFISSWSDPRTLDFVVQKPSVDQTRKLSLSKKCVADAGVWLLSGKATLALMEQSGWVSDEQAFAGGLSKTVDLYSDFGLALGKEPLHPLPVGSLTTSIFEPKCEFFHFGTSRQVVEAMTRLHSSSVSASNSKLGFTTTELRRPGQHVQNVEFQGNQNLNFDFPIWIENSYISDHTHLLGDNFVTGLTKDDWTLTLPLGQCLDLVPYGSSDFCVRTYGFDDSFSGPIGSPDTNWSGIPIGEWFENHGLQIDSIVPDLTMDIQKASIFPVLAREKLSSEFVQWMVDPAPEPNQNHIATYREAKKLSAREIQSEANLERVYRQRREFSVLGLEKVIENRSRSAFYKMDLNRAAQLAAREPERFRQVGFSEEEAPARKMREQMFKSELDRLTGGSQSEQYELNAFESLKSVIVQPERLSVRPPRSNVLSEQIVWGRSPVRFDLAGGWTDTPPYSLLNGGRVVNVAVELNGQDPIHVFGRVTNEPKIVLKSIDLGSQVTIETFEELNLQETVGSEFALARTALNLAGFGNTYCDLQFPTLKKQLENFGGGLELNMLAAVPKGSGLGTSSILSATLLATVGSICSHNWSNQDVFERVLVSEQLLSSGGGWQDQVGGVLKGLKLISTEPGPHQTIQAHWLPEQVLGDGAANVTALLFYTGITRTAKGVLKEIVRGMFLNDHDRLAILKQIGNNTEPTVDAIMRNSYDDLGAAIRKSWELNQALDSGTCPSNVGRIYNLIDDYVLGAKLLGAGGGGFLLMLCKDLEAASRVRKLLSDQVEEPGSRFVDFRISQSGLSLTRS